MLLDIIAISLIIIFFIRGYMKGIIVAAFSVLAIVLGIIVSLKLSEVLATWLFEKGYVTSGWAQLISYIILFVGVVWGVRLIAKAIESAMQAVMLGWVNKGLGGMFYAFIVTMAWSALLWLGTEMKIVTPEMIAESKTYEYIQPLAPWVAAKVGYLWPMAKDVFSDLEHFFDNVNEYIPQHVGTAG
ncbi:MAG: CvpA family protein [Chitinophagales bacterium]|nr:CvpA family protein [Chitinophagales bacterium]